jgi:general L-amino acid transport system permease protein
MTATPTAAPKEPRKPPVDETTPLGWARKNLFDGAWNILLTTVAAVIAAYAIYKGVRFLFVSARWEIIHRNVTRIMVDLFPRAELWRVWMALYELTLAVGLLIGASDQRDQAARRGGVVHHLGDIARRMWPFGLLIALVLWQSRSLVTAGHIAIAIVIFVVGHEVGIYLPDRRRRRALLVSAALIPIVFITLMFFGGVGWGNWGGLLLTLFLATAGIVLSFPIGLLLALGRRSTFPVVRIFSVLYIELIRGVPLITLLFMGNLMLGLFLPRGFDQPHRVTRAVIALVIFTAAYLAEIVRGGLQSVPRGQTEAGQAVGLSPVTITRRIVLPQALRNVIPALVGQFISLFKDTSLVAVIGLFDLLGVLNSLPSQPDFVGQNLFAEVLVIAALIYWVFTYTMSRESQRLERRLGVGER